MAPRRFDRDRVRALRRARDITQSDLGDAVGVGDSTVASWELGSSTPDGEKLPLLARFFGLPLDDLFPAPQASSPTWPICAAMPATASTRRESSSAPRAQARSPMPSAVSVA